MYLFYTIIRQNHLSHRLTVFAKHELGRKMFSEVRRNGDWPMRWRQGDSGALWGCLEYMNSRCQSIKFAEARNIVNKLPQTLNFFSCFLLIIKIQVWNPQVTSYHLLSCSWEYIKLLFSKWVNIYPKMYVILILSISLIHLLQSLNKWLKKKFSPVELLIFLFLLSFLLPKPLESLIE